MPDSPFKEVVIPRDKVNYGSFVTDCCEEHRGKCCYMGHVAIALGVKGRGIYLWSVDRFGYEFTDAVSRACDHDDEARAIELFAQQNIPVRFVDSLEVA